MHQASWVGVRAAVAGDHARNRGSRRCRGSDPEEALRAFAIAVGHLLIPGWSVRLVEDQEPPAVHVANHRQLAVSEVSDPRRVSKRRQLVREPLLSREGAGLESFELGSCVSVAQGSTPL
jgi:hypothetical protein